MEAETFLNRKSPSLQGKNNKFRSFFAARSWFPNMSALETLIPVLRVPWGTCSEETANGLGELEKSGSWRGSFGKCIDFAAFSEALIGKLSPP